MAKTLTLVNTTTPFLKIYIPATGDYVSFLGGQLEIAEDDPNYEAVHAEAVRNPAISIMVNSTTCEFCGEVFTGKAGKAQLGAHIKKIHPDVWDAQQAIDRAKADAKELKSRAGYVCDVCSPVQEFGDKGSLSEHVKLLHTAPPELDADGNDVGGKEDRRPGERGIPAAVATT